MSRTRLLAATACFVLGTGCRDTARFDTAAGEAYCGSMVTAPLVSDAFVPDGQPPRLRVRLTLDTSHLATTLGTLSSDDTEGLCAPQPLFTDASLRAISQVQHDALFGLDFGDGRDVNLLTWVDTTCLGAVLAVVSLMKNDDVELRLLKPATTPPPNADALDRPGFALFPLARQKGTCGF